MLAGHRGPTGLRERPLCGAVVASGVGLILGALILDLVLGIDMHVVLSSGILAALAVGISWLLWRIRKPK